MAKSQQTFNKKEKEKKRQKKRVDKMHKKEERKSNSVGGDLDSMMAYVDEFGNIVDTPPEAPNKKHRDNEDEAILASAVGIVVEEDESSGYKGIVSFFDEEKGFGFIKDADSKKEYYVHVTGVIDKIKDRDRVSFLIEKGPKGFNAVQVKKI